VEKLKLGHLHIARQWALPTGIVALGVVAVVAGQPHPGNTKAALSPTSLKNSQSQSIASPAATVAPNVSVNGQSIPTGQDGTTTVPIPGGTARIDVSDGTTHVTTSEHSTSGDTSNSQSNNVNVHIDSSSNGGASQGSTQLYGFNSNINGSNYSSSSVSSTNVGNVNITQP
jgi:hypothetical protein